MTSFLKKISGWKKEEIFKALFLQESIILVNCNLTLCSCVCFFFVSIAVIFAAQFLTLYSIDTAFNTQQTAFENNVAKGGIACAKTNPWSHWAV